MISSKLLELDRALRNLSLAEQQWLLERLSKQVSDRIKGTGQFADPTSLNQQLEVLARDPEIQREMKAIEQEFAMTEMDGLRDE